MHLLRRPLTLLVALAFLGLGAACNDSGPDQPTTDPNDTEAPLEDHDSLLGDAPSNNDLPEDGKFDAVYPAQFDLADLQSPVKSQGSRGVCSIFGTVALMEHLYIKEGTFSEPDFSEQFLQWSAKVELGSFTHTGGSSARSASATGPMKRPSAGSSGSSTSGIQPATASWAGR